MENKTIFWKNKFGQWFHYLLYYYIVIILDYWYHDWLLDTECIIHTFFKLLQWWLLFILAIIKYVYCVPCSIISIYNYNQQCLLSVIKLACQPLVTYSKRCKVFWKWCKWKQLEKSSYSTHQPSLLKPIEMHFLWCTSENSLLQDITSELSWRWLCLSL